MHYFEHGNITVKIQLFQKLWFVIKWFSNTILAFMIIVGKIVLVENFAFCHRYIVLVVLVLFLPSSIIDFFY